MQLRKHSKKRAQPVQKASFSSTYEVGRGPNEWATGSTRDNADSISVEQLSDGNGECRKQDRCRQIAAPVGAGFFVSLSAQPENGDRFRLRVNNPVFRNMGLGIIGAFVNQIPFRLIGADNFQGQVGAEPEAVLPARVCGQKEQQEIGLAELS